MNEKPTLSITIETVDDSVEIPIDSDNAFQVRTDGIYLVDTFYLWEQIISIMIVNRDVVDCVKNKIREIVLEDVPHMYQDRLLNNL